MATLFKRKTIDPISGKLTEGKIWWISYTENGKQVRRSLKVTSKALADMKKADIERNLERGIVGLPRLDIDTRGVLTEFRNAVILKLSDSWARRFDQMLRPFIKFILHGRYYNIHQISTQVVERFLQERHPELSPGSWNDELRAIDRFFRFAMEREYVVKNPCARITKRHEDKVPVEILTPQELALIFKYAYKDALPFYKLLLYTGMRDGEARFLQWKDVNLEPGQERLHVRSTVVHRTKNRRERLVPLATEAIELLKEMLARRDKGSPWVFPGRDGKPKGQNRNTWVSTLKRIEKEEGVRIDKGFHMTGMHLFRHTFASNALASGVDIRTVQDWLGHASILQTQRYLNLLPDQKHKQIQKLKIQIGNTPAADEGQRLNDLKL